MNAANPQRSRGIDQAEIRFLVDKNADGIIVVDEDGIVLFANPAAEQIFGRPLNLLVGSPIGTPLIAGETTQITILRPGGDQIEAEIRVVNTMWDRQRAYLASLRDISARQAMEERLRQSAKMEAVGRLTAGIAHDFNNLLTVVLGNLESIQRQSAAATPAGTQAVDNAIQGARRAAALTERLLAFARRKPLEPCIIDVNDLVSGMSQLLQRTLGERISVRTRLDDEVWPVKTDPTELEAAILNLAVNARDAMPAGGKLIIETANVELDSAYAAANPDVNAGAYVLIAVTDTGMGMTDDIINKAFEPFFTTKPDGRGTGLGLSQVYGFVKQTGGHVKLYSELSIGTTAKIYFPRAFSPSDALDRADQSAYPAHAPRARSNETILVVEDDDDVRNYTAGSLRELGYGVLEAGEARSALDIVEREGEIRLLFTDLGLPGNMDGKSLAEHVRAIRPAMKILITTAYAGGALVHNGRLDEGVDLLSKPFTFVGLANRIRQLLDRGNLKDARILLVEDEALLRMWVADVFAGAGLQADEAGTFREAEAKIRSAGDSFAAAVVDLGLPDHPGEQLVAEIRALQPRLPIILTSGFADTDISRKFSADPLLRILTKPFDPDVLLTTLAELGVRAAGRS